jgi:hypothetical protein
MKPAPRFRCSPAMSARGSSTWPRNGLVDAKALRDRVVSEARVNL